MEALVAQVFLAFSMFMQRYAMESVMLTLATNPHVTPVKEHFYPSVKTRELNNGNRQRPADVCIDVTAAYDFMRAQENK